MYDSWSQSTRWGGFPNHRYSHSVPTMTFLCSCDLDCTHHSVNLTQMIFRISASWPGWVGTRYSQQPVVYLPHQRVLDCIFSLWELELKCVYMQYHMICIAVVFLSISPSLSFPLSLSLPVSPSFSLPPYLSLLFTTYQPHTQIHYRTKKN